MKKISENKIENIYNSFDFKNSETMKTAETAKFVV